ncbi:hypothetical protein Efla_000792 [Eimeria flavescens]
MEIEALSNVERRLLLRHIRLFNNGLWPENSYEDYMQRFQAKPLKREGQPWTEEEDALLLQLTEQYDVNFGGTCMPHAPNFIFRNSRIKHPSFEFSGSFVNEKSFKLEVKLKATFLVLISPFYLLVAAVCVQLFFRVCLRNNPWIYISWEMQRDFEDVHRRYLELVVIPKNRKRRCEFVLSKCMRPLFFSRYFKVLPSTLVLVPSAKHFNTTAAAEFSLPSAFARFKEEDCP